jgi:hypothetical protein
MLSSDLQRGSAEEDSVRRDLTIASMLLRVTRKGARPLSTPAAPEALPEAAPEAAARPPPRSDSRATASGSSILRRRWRLATRRVRQRLRTRRPLTSLSSWSPQLSDASAASSSAAAAADAADLDFVLVDYHGGIEDVSSRLLRCPVSTPTDRKDRRACSPLSAARDQRLLAALHPPFALSADERPPCPTRGRRHDTRSSAGAAIHVSPNGAQPRHHHATRG